MTQCQNRYDGQVAVFGSGLQEKLGKQRYFLVRDPFGQKLPLCPLASGHLFWSLLLAYKGGCLVVPSSHPFSIFFIPGALFPGLVPLSLDDHGFFWPWDLNMQ